MNSISILAGRSGRARTCDPRFWRPVLYQLSYTPAGTALPPVRAVSSIGQGGLQGRSPKHPVQAEPSAPDLASPDQEQSGRRETMTAQTATRHIPAPQTPHFPKPNRKHWGFRSPPAADVGRLQARDRQGNHPRGDRHGGAERPDRLVRRARQAKPGRLDADGAELDLPHLLDDQADRLGRHHDADRGRPFPARRPHRQIHSGICQPEGRRREQRPARSRAVAATDHGPGPASPHFRHHLRSHR